MNICIIDSCGMRKEWGDIMSPVRPMGAADRAVMELLRYCYKKEQITYCTPYDLANYPFATKKEFYEDDVYDVIIHHRAIVPQVLTYEAKHIAWFHDDVTSPPMEASLPYCQFMDACIFLSEWHRERVFRTTGPLHHALIGEGIDYESYMSCRKISKIPGTAIYAGAPFKGLPSLLKMLKWCMRQDKPAPFFSVDIYTGMSLHGSSDVQVMQVLDPLVESLQSYCRINLSEPVDTSQLYAAYATAQYFVHGGDYPETFGNVFQEAAALGCTIISRDSVGAPMHIFPGYYASNLYQSWYDAQILPQSREFQPKFWRDQMELVYRVIQEPRRMKQ